MSQSRSPFAAGLLASGPVDAWRNQMMLYGWLVGSWQALRIDHADDGTAQEFEAEIHFDWVLEGRAIQDVWISPPLKDRDPAKPLRRSMFGSTLRIYDPAADNWRIIWSNPSTGDVETMIGRKVGEDIVQLGVGADGTPMRWSFTKIEADAFHWLGEREVAPGEWRLRGEFFARRMA